MCFLPVLLVCWFNMDHYLNLIGKIINTNWEIKNLALTGFEGIFLVLKYNKTITPICNNSYFYKLLKQG